MPAPVAPNPDLALWIAGLGFLSSLAVVAINSFVTLRSKNKDIQLKKDEQAYGFRMEFLKRKLNAGEKAIGKINVMLAALAVIRRNRENYLDNIQLSPDNSKFEAEDMNTYLLKFIEVDTQPDNYYHAYFVVDEAEEEKIKELGSVRLDLDTDIHTLADDFNEKSEEYYKENPDSEELPDELEKADGALNDLILEYLNAHDKFVKHLESQVKTIHKQMKEMFEAA